MKQKMSLPRSPGAPQIVRGLPAGTGFVIAGLASLLFWGMIAGIAVIV